MCGCGYTSVCGSQRTTSGFIRQNTITLNRKHNLPLIYNSMSPRDLPVPAFPALGVSSARHHVQLFFCMHSREGTQVLMLKKQVLLFPQLLMGELGGQCFPVALADLEPCRPDWPWFQKKSTCLPPECWNWD